MKTAHRDGLWRLLLLVALLALVHGLPARADGVHVLSVKGAIGPASADYLVRGLDRAAEAKARLVVIELDTPGGLDTSMRDIIKAILASGVPVATYVAPQGARGQRRHLHPLRQSHRGDGAGHQSGRGDAGGTGAGGRARRRAGEERREARGSSAAGRQGKEGGQ